MGSVPIIYYYYDPRHFGSTSPRFKYTPNREIVYPENKGEVLSKLCIRSEYTIETDLVYASTGCPKSVDNSKQIQP
jgi:hypothetical protein